MPIGLQLEGWLEVVPQVLLRSALLCYWVNRPKRWLNVVLGILFFVAMALPLLGFLIRPHSRRQCRGTDPIKSSPSKPGL